MPAGLGQTNNDFQFALEFPLTGEFDVNMLAVGREYSADVWHWKAGCGNPVGWVDDKRHIVSPKLAPEAHEYSLGGRAKVYIARIMDQGIPSYQDIPPPTTFRGEIVDSYEPCEPTGSLADVRGKGVHDFQKLGEAEAKKFFEHFAANGGKILSANGAVRRRVGNGEFAVGIVDTDDYHVARREGKPIGAVYPDADGMGTVLIPNCAVLIANGPNPDAGGQFIDYLLRAETEQALAASDAAQIPLRPGVAVPSDMVRQAQIKPMQLDYGQLESVLEDISRGFLQQWVDRNSQ